MASPAKRIRTSTTSAAGAAEGPDRQRQRKAPISMLYSNPAALGMIAGFFSNENRIDKVEVCHPKIYALSEESAYFSALQETNPDACHLSIHKINHFIGVCNGKLTAGTKQALSEYICKKVASGSNLEEVLSQFHPAVLSKLDYLDLRGVHLTNEQFMALLQRFPQLKTLKVQGAVQLNSAAIQALTRLCPSLTGLDLSYQESLSDADVQTLADAYAGQMTHLTLSLCRNLTDRAMTSLASCRLLTHLDIAVCRKLTDEGLASLAASCPELTNLSLSECIFSRPAVTALVASCGKLTFLDLGDCAQFTNADIQALRAARPGLHIYYYIDPW